MTTTPAFARFHHVSVEVSSVERSFNFYQHLFGFEQVLRLDTPDGRGILHLRQPKSSIVLELIGVAEVETNKHVHLGFSVERLSDAVELLEQLHIRIERGPLVVGVENMVFVFDPDGYLIEINDGLSLT